MKGKHLVEACANILVTSGYTDYAKNLWKSGPDFCSSNYLRNFFRHQWYPWFVSMVSMKDSGLHDWYPWYPWFHDTDLHEWYPWYTWGIPISVNGIRGIHDGYWYPWRIIFEKQSFLSSQWLHSVTSEATSIGKRFLRSAVKTSRLKFYHIGCRQRDVKSDNYTVLTANKCMRSLCCAMIANKIVNFNVSKIGASGLMRSTASASKRITLGR